MLARERVLDVAQGERQLRLRMGRTQAVDGDAIAAAKRFQPALRFLPEIVEGAHARPSFR
jgi:hypothetical protein